MINKISENKNTIIYFVDSIGRIEVKKDYKYQELTSYPIVKIREDKDTITYRMPDELLCIVNKKLKLAVKEVLIRYYILKTFWDNNIYIKSSKYQFRRPNHICSKQDNAISAPFVITFTEKW